MFNDYFTCILIIILYRLIPLKKKKKTQESNQRIKIHLIKVSNNNILCPIKLYKLMFIHNFFFYSITLNHLEIEQSKVSLYHIGFKIGFESWHKI